MPHVFMRSLFPRPGFLPQLYAPARSVACTDSKSRQAFMLDLLFVGTVVALFALTYGLVMAIARLGRVE